MCVYIYIYIYIDYITYTCVCVYIYVYNVQKGYYRFALENRMLGNRECVYVLTRVCYVEPYTKRVTAQVPSPQCYYKKTLVQPCIKHELDVMCYKNVCMTKLTIYHAMNARVPSPHCDHTCHNRPPSEIDRGLFLAVFAGSEGRYLFHRIG